MIFFKKKTPRDNFEKVSKKLLDYSCKRLATGGIVGLLDLDIMEKQIIADIEKMPEILTMTNQKGENIGMLACKHGSEKIALYALNNKEASVQQDNDGWNIGMWAVRYDMKKAMLKSLDNSVARKQINKSGETMLAMAKRMNIDIDESYYKREALEQNQEAISDIYDEVFGK